MIIIFRKKLITILFLMVLGLFYKAEAQSSALRHADSLYVVGEYTKAIEKYETLQEQDYYVLLQLAKAHKAKGTYKDALMFYQKAIDKDPESAIASLEYGKLLMSNKQFNKADSIFEKLVSKHHQNPDFQYQLGLIKESLNDSTAINYYHKAFSLDNSHQKSCFKISKHFLAHRMYDSVTKYTTKGLEVYPENPKLISVLGQLNYKREYYKKAIPYFLKLIELGHQSEFVYKVLAISYHREYEHEDALLYYKKWLSYDRENSAIYYAISEILLENQNYKEAEEYFNTGLELQEFDRGRKYSKLASIFRLQEKWKEAMQYLRKAIKENPNNTLLHHQLAVYADGRYTDPETKISYYNKFLETLDKIRKAKNEDTRQIKMNEYLENQAKKRLMQLETEIAKNK